MANVSIPKEFAGKKQLIAVPEREYRAFRAFQRDRETDREFQEVLEAEAEVRAGKVIRAASAAEALKEARVRGWVD